MRSPTPLPDLSSWVELREHRPPRALDLLFWGTGVTTGLTMGLAIAVEGREAFREMDPLLSGFVLSSAVGLVLVLALWPFLAWSPAAPWPRRAASALFLVISLNVVFFGNSTVFLLVCAAAMNAVAVFGLAGLLGYATLLSGSALVVTLALPGDPLSVSLTYAAGLLFLAFLSGVAFIGLVVSAQRSERTRELLAELEAAHADLRRHADRVRELTVAEERARMSREMHDSTGHYLTALTMTLSNALRFRTSRPDAAWDEVEQARELAGEALTDTRRWVRALRPLRLEGRAGASAMRAMAESFQGGGVRIDFTDSGDWPRDLAPEAELVCYRALQEGLTNAMRHSGGDRVEVAVTASAEEVTVTVTDNGGGADTDALASGFGLRGLRERVRAVRGSVTAGERAGGGFRLSVRVPVARRPAGLTAGGVA
ncbi:signal transduction histidine kinase [Nocardiopsis sp. Huas11]|uniref:sensor histidine kinase n=1 Tax=Nocardiopsis sp. Huas11 TaxID=2183912 RepID=UPI000EAC8258|nr:sensor histidine kinase [Nocardiopsis sp. Huas11]RKS06095.1 signal transduction histidine kinase [Nocardiopsis sp. Huas11]